MGPTGGLKPLTDIDDPRLVKALAHPLRVRILGILEGGMASPSELSQALGVPLGNVSYHVRQLAELGLIELVRTTPRRGAVEHHYRAVARPRITDEAWAQAPEIVRQALIGSTLAQISDQVNAAAMEGGFSSDDAHLSRMPLLLDRRGWDELSAEMYGLLDRIDRIREESAARLRKGDHQEEKAVTVVMMLFEPAELSLERSDKSRRPARKGRRAPARSA
jgi:DNA-binding transcriptional ArsR family regulator